MKSQKIRTMYFGHETLYYKSSKQKLNTKISTEAQLVRKIEYVPFNVWMIIFMKTQGYAVKKNVLFQDNNIEIRMEVNVRN